MRKYLIILFSLFSLLASAGTYYVSTTGTNGAYPTRGTLANPWLTWQYAMDNSTAGDTVYFRGGVYNVTSTVSKNSGGGTIGNLVCYMGYPDDIAMGNYPILDGTGKTSGSPGVTLSDIGYFYIYGLKVANHEQKNDDDWDVDGFLVMSCNDFTFERCIVQNSGFRGWDLNVCTGDINIINCDSYDNVDHLTTETYPGNHGQGFIATNSGSATYIPGTTIHFYGCRAWGNSDNGICSNYGDVEIYENCWSFDNGRLLGDGVGFKTGPAPYVNGVVIRTIINCIAAYNLSEGEGTGNGFDENTGDGVYYNYKFDNNLAYGNGTGFITWPLSPQNNAIRLIRNNIAYNNGTNYEWHWANYPTDTYNSWNNPPNVTVNAYDFVSLDTAQLRRPRKADGSLPDITFGTLVEGSDLIDAGTDVGLAYEGTAPDLGYVEYEEGEASTATDILTFTFTEQTGSATINATLHTVSIEVEWDAVITSLTPTITVSGGATIDPTSGTARNFTNSVVYTVTAEDEVTEQEWTVTVTQEAEPSSAIKLLKKGIRLLKKGTKFLK